VQAAIINDEIRRLRDKHKKVPVYAVIEDLGASGGYYVAVAADKIYVNRSSVVGSIGVLMNGFGFVGTLEKLGVERRLLTAGEHKASSTRSPRSASSTPAPRAGARRAAPDVHHDGEGGAWQSAEGRREDLQRAVLTGEESVELGLADGFGDLGYVARDLVASRRRSTSPRRRRLGPSRARVGTGAAEAFTDRWLERALGLR